MNSISDMIDTKQCPVCNVGDAKLKIVFSYGELYKCSMCGLAFTVFYDLNTFKAANKSWEKPSSKYVDIMSLDYSRNDAKERLNYLKKYIKGNKILEYGSNVGSFLYETANAGFDVTGVDHSDVFLFMNMKDKIKFYKSEALNFHTNERYDAIVAFHFLEHIEDPVLFLNKAKSFLKQQGVLFLELPNYGSMNRQINGKKWRLFYDYHIYYYDPKSLQYLLERLDFRIVSLYTIQPLDDFIDPVYMPVRHFLWSTIKRLIYSDIGIKDVLDHKERKQIANIQEEEKIYKSFKAKIYRLELRTKSFFGKVLIPFTKIIELFGKGDVIRVIATIKSILLIITLNLI